MTATALFATQRVALRISPPGLGGTDAIVLRRAVRMAAHVESWFDVAPLLAFDLSGCAHLHFVTRETSRTITRRLAFACEDAERAGLRVTLDIEPMMDPCASLA